MKFKKLRKFLLSLGFKSQTTLYDGKFFLPIGNKVYVVTYYLSSTGRNCIELKIEETSEGKRDNLYGCEELVVLVLSDHFKHIIQAKQIQDNRNKLISIITK